MQSPVFYKGVLLICTLGCVLTISSQFVPSKATPSAPAVLKVHLKNSRRSLTTADALGSQQAVTIAQTKSCDRSKVHRNLTRADLLLVIPANVDRLDLAKASRAWRKGVPTAFIMDQELHLLQNASAVQEDLTSNLEFWASSPDVAPTNPLTEKAGDFRAALAPFLANKTAEPNSYKWMLYGDDDTFWFIDNALVYLSQLDPDMPYLLSDNIWMKERNSDTAVHPNPRAPRCLPCGYEDPLQEHVPPGSFNAPRGCPCSSDMLCHADVNSVMYNHADCAAQWPFITHVPSPGYWYFIHGGAGAIMSRGLMQLSTFDKCRDFLFGPMPRMSGDAMFTLMVWHVMGIPPTDPGYGFFRPHVQMMDPGWLSGRTQRGPEDQGTWDGGNDPVGVVKRFQQALHNTAGDDTLEQLDHVLTVHFRGRYAADDVAQLSPQDGNSDNFKATVHLHHHMARLYDQYISMCPSTDAANKARM